MAGLEVVQGGDGEVGPRKHERLQDLLVAEALLQQKQIIIETPEEGEHKTQITILPRFYQCLIK